MNEQKPLREVARNRNLILIKRKNAQNLEKNEEIRSQKTNY